MNAIIGLCHFCEAHGPRPLFCTFTTDTEKHTVEPSPFAAQCSGCTSLGPDTVFISKENNGIVYCSRESLPNNEVAAFLRHAAIRSITCEVSWNKEGGVVYFGDSRGHVLSLTFQLKDTRARGLKRWFSIVVLMKDKMLLLNITPVLSEHMRKIAKELQEYAEKVYDEEQKICSQRALRLNTGRNDFGPSRSLTQLTGQENVFQKLHTNFTWMLKTGALTYTETLYTSEDLMKKLNNTTKFLESTEPQECIPIRVFEKMIGRESFRIILYCILTGINIIIKSVIMSPEDIVKCISQLIPIKDIQTFNNITIKNCNEDLKSSATTCVLEEINNELICTWLGNLPIKCPTIMNRIDNAVHNTSFNDDTLLQYIKSLHMEWSGTARTIKLATQSASSPEAVSKLKLALGITPQDELLINYWNQVFCI